MYSCSSTVNNSPSCYEIFSKEKFDGLCNMNYEKSKAKCSQQNLIGVCRYISKENNQAVTAVFSKPFDTVEKAQSYCISTEINGIFTTSYKEPTASIDSNNQAFLNWFVCFSALK